VPTVSRATYDNARMGIAIFLRLIRARQLRMDPVCADRYVLVPWRLRQDLDVPLRSMHADPLPILDQPGGMLHPDDGR
jgi:hypothetical protein